MHGALKRKGMNASLCPMDQWIRALISSLPPKELHALGRDDCKHLRFFSPRRLPSVLPRRDWNFNVLQLRRSDG